ncbi:MAG TPA: hypothetical protein VNJ09_08545 [Chthonomonadales bacterium]|nr:hypothetical protein [Chthonomonadales bacterium]
MDWEKYSERLTDNRKVVLIKSLATNNRFYALVSPDSGIRNADALPHMPDDLLLGVAYPCLEDGLNDFAVIRTTYETLEFFPNDDGMREELMEIVEEARKKLILRLTEIRDRIANRTAHFLGTNMEEFKAYATDIVFRGYPRRNLDSMMKLNVFASVAQAEGHPDGSEPFYFYEFRDPALRSKIKHLSARQFAAALFADVLDSVLDDANYANRYTFDRNVFQKFIAIMFVNYATTDPVFYGTNKADYGVSDEKDMSHTPLYMAVGQALRAIEAQLQAEEELAKVCYEEEHVVEHLEADRVVELPGILVNEDVLMGPIASICAAAHQLSKHDDHEMAEFGRMILASASRLVSELKRLNIVSPFAIDLGVYGLRGEQEDKSHLDKAT